MSIHRYANQSLRARLLVGFVPSWLQSHSRRQYITSAVLASPPYISPSSFKSLVERRDTLTAKTGVPHVLDHIVPLNHPLVCGLNVPWNIQVIPKRTNALKSNYWFDEYDPPGWFTHPEQFALSF